MAHVLAVAQPADSFADSAATPRPSETSTAIKVARTQVRRVGRLSRLYHSNRPLITPAPGNPLEPSI